MTHSKRTAHLTLALRALIVLAAITPAALRPIEAQGAPAAVRIQVRDTSGQAAPGVELRIVRGLNEVVAAGTSDSVGRAVLLLPPAAADYQLVLRKIGYERAERFFRSGRDSLTFDVTLRRTIQSLDAVVVTAEEDVKRKSYHVDADQIAGSTEILLDATDILAKLRPDMICGRSCSPMASIAATTRNPARKCPGLVFQQRQPMSCPVDDTPPSILTNVWVNGRRIRSVALNEMALARQHGVLAGLSPGTMTVLSEISPQHIAEVTYVDELDASVGRIGSEGALFIVLKSGIGYDPGKGSYVVDVPATSTHSSAAPAQLPAYRYRVLGVYDPETGDPIAGADVIDIQTGTRARTTVTGTVSLLFLPDGGSPVRITKAGYEDLSVAVEISAEHTAPITLMLTRKP